MNLIWIKSENYKFVKIDVLKIKSIESVKYTAKIRRLDITTYDGELIKIFEKRGDNQFYLYEAFTEFIKDLVEIRDKQTACKNLQKSITKYNEYVEGIEYHERSKDK